MHPESQMRTSEGGRYVGFGNRGTIMKNAYNGVAVPGDGKAIGYEGGVLKVPDNPIIPFIEGDGTGRDIWKASRRGFDGGAGKEGWRERRGGAGGVSWGG